MRHSPPTCFSSLPEVPLRDPSDPSPSALFARRLMHYCSSEIASLCACPPPPTTSLYFHEPDPHTPFFPNPSNASVPWSPTAPLEALQEEADDALELDEFEEGLDVLLILERAYERALKAHVVPPVTGAGRANTPPPPPLPRARAREGSAEPVPLMTGSSTALLAVLDHAPPAPIRPPPVPPVSGFYPSPAAPPPHPSAAAGAHGTTATAMAATDECDAVIRIAHLGDCMGMLVRGDEIAWRSDEMWWSVRLSLLRSARAHDTR